MPAYIVGIINETRLNDDICAYLENIDSTLQSYEGRFIIHGRPYLWMEDEPTGDFIVIEFPNLELASDWYESPVYRAIKPLRTANSIGTIFLVQGVSSSHRAIDILV